MVAMEERAKVKSLSERIGAGIRTRVQPLAERGLQNMFEAATFLPRTTIGGVRGVVQGYREAGRLPEQVTPGAPATNPQVTTSPLRPQTPMRAADAPGKFQRFGPSQQNSIRVNDTGQLFTLDDLEGVSSQGNVGLRGRGSYSVTDIAAGQPADNIGTVQVPSRTQLGTARFEGPTAAEQQAARQAEYGRQIFSPVSEANRYRATPDFGTGPDAQAKRLAWERDLPAMERNAGLRQRAADIKAEEAAAQTLIAQQQIPVQALENQGRVAAANVAGEYGLRSAAAQGELLGAQADVARRSTELFNQWQAAPEGPEKDQLREAYNLLQGTQTKAPQIHFGETESMTEQGVVSEPYAATLDPQGGLRVLRQGGGSSIVPPGQQAVAARAALDPTQQANVDAYFQKFIKDNKRNATPEEVLAYIATLKK